MFVVGVDVGGTFVDFAVFDEDTGELRVWKEASRTRDLTEAFMQGLRAMRLDLRQVRRIVHATTLATNAILERSGGKTAVIITEGHKDVIEHGVGRRYDGGGLWNIYWQRKQPLVPRHLRYEVPERLLATGEVLTKLQEKDVLAVIERLKEAEVQAIAICFLHSYLNPTHERQAADLVRKHLPDVSVSLSAEIVPELGEFERWSTTVVNAYLAPMMRDYIMNLRDALGRADYSRDIFYMASNGGIAPESSAVAFPVRHIMSGPAAGVSAGLSIARATDLRNIITYDMGGTSTDVCLTNDLKPVLVGDTLLEGVALKTPLLDVRSVGAGGGSIAWVDDRDELQVGPRSAGALPGPVCYGEGGTEITVTDANLILGRLSADTIAGGSMRLHKDLSEAAMKALGEKVNVPDIHRLADGVIKICVNNMSGLVRTLSIERGYDPRDFVLVSIGGAGPMHATLIAEELAIAKVLVPNNPGNACAFGLLTSELRYDYVSPYVVGLREADPSHIKALFKEMENEGVETLSKEGLSSDRIDISLSADMRYRRQSWLLNVPMTLDFDHLSMETAFNDQYQRTYGYRREGTPVELVYLRATASGQVDKPSVHAEDVGERQVSKALREYRPVYFDGSFVNCPVYERTLLPPGSAFEGPAVVEEYGSTTAVFPGWKASVDKIANIVLERSGG